MKSETSAGITIVIVLAVVALISIPLWNGYGRTGSNGMCSVPVYGYTIVNVYPHDRSAFTEGLVYDGQTLYESTGLYGNSTVRHVDLSTGKVLRIYRLPGEYFGEGLTVWNDHLVQLTWRSMRGFVYNKSDLEQTRNFSYRGEGWGITSNRLSLIMSDGSDTLYFKNPDTFANDRFITVKDCGEPVSRLNELEFVNGSILANIYPGTRIAIISPETGTVTGWINLKGLETREKNITRVDVLNGIAYNPENGTLLITGKLWPELFEIDIRGNGGTVRI